MAADVMVNTKNANTVASDASFSQDEEFITFSLHNFLREWKNPTKYNQFIHSGAEEIL